jgi:hypothetical protein
VLQFVDECTGNAAKTLFSAMYENVARCRTDNFTLVPGLVSLFMESLLAGGSTAARPALCVWSAVLSVRLLEVSYLFVCKKRNAVSVS